MTEQEAQAWLDRYVVAWRTYDPEAIGDLFSEDAEYRYHPWNDPVRGRAEIVRAWTGPEGEESARDDPNSWRASYRPMLVAGDRVISTGTSEYFEPDGSRRELYYNLFVMRFDEAGRCADFTEWFMKEHTHSAGS